MGWRSVWRPFGAKSEPEAASEPEPAPEPVPELVVDAVGEAARELACRIWFGIPIPRKSVGAAQDQALTHAVAEQWLEVRGELIVRGGVDPRPETTTYIPMR